MKKLLTWIVTTPMLLLAGWTCALAEPVVLFDEGHGQRFLVGQEGPLDLSGLGEVFKGTGYTLQTSPAPLTTELLKGADILVISGAFISLRPEEVDAVQTFVASGGGLAVMLHIAPPLSNLLARLEVDFTNGTLREMKQLVADNPLDFRVTDLTPHSLFENLEGFSVYGSWALRGTAGYARDLARTTDHSWVDLDRDNRLSKGDVAQTFAVLVAGELGDGRFAVFGDDAIFQNRFLDSDNRQLASNLARWLGSLTP
ncbi:MAG: DUF4350 domain-containing protein [Desulfuromonas sp.]|nr:MAG: DUF4350 domain-containing protein [Desulfuromonas sp.]